MDTLLSLYRNMSLLARLADEMHLIYLISSWSRRNIYCRNVHVSFSYSFIAFVRPTRVLQTHSLGNTAMDSYEKYSCGFIHVTCGPFGVSWKSGIGKIAKKLKVVRFTKK